MYGSGDPYISFKLPSWPKGTLGRTVSAGQNKLAGKFVVMR
jgi:hypothetical protein